MDVKGSLLLPLNLTVPGAKGLTEETSIAGDDGQWLFEATNAIYTREGLLAPREFFRRVHTGMPDPEDDDDYLIPGIATNLYYPTYAGHRYFVSVLNNIYTINGYPLFGSSFLVDDGMEQPTAPTSTKHWKAVYLSKSGDSAERGVYFFAKGELPKYYSGDFFFSQIPSGPRYEVAHAAFGRLWATDGYTMKWSILLNGKDWTGAGSGELNLRSYLGMGEAVTAIADFNNFLILFTNKAVLIFQNPFNIPVDAAGTLGDQGVMSLKEKIDGTGCVGMNAWCSVGEELFFYSISGLYKLSRVMSDGGSNPVGVVCPQINNNLIHAIQILPEVYNENEYYQNTKIRLNYHPFYGFMTVETGTELYGTYLVWLNRPIGQNSYAVTQWGNYSPDRYTGKDGEISFKNTIIEGIYSAGNFYFPRKALVAVVRVVDDDGYPSGYAGVAIYGLEEPDPNANPTVENDGFIFRLKSAWMDFGESPAGPQAKLPKDLKLIYRRPRGPYTGANPGGYAGYTPTDLPVEFNLTFDYDSTTKRIHQFTAPVETTFATDGLNTNYPSSHMTTPIPLSGSGSLVQWEIKAEITDIAHEKFAVQRAGFQTKLGRINQGI